MVTQTNKQSKNKIKQKNLPALTEDTKFNSTERGIQWKKYKMLHCTLLGEEEKDSKVNIEMY